MRARLYIYTNTYKKKYTKHCWFGFKFNSINVFIWKIIWNTHNSMAAHTHTLAYTQSRLKFPTTNNAHIFCSIYLNYLALVIKYVSCVFCLFVCLWLWLPLSLSVSPLFFTLIVSNFGLLCVFSAILQLLTIARCTLKTKHTHTQKTIGEQ